MQSVVVNQLLGSLPCCPQIIWTLLQQQYNSPNKAKVSEVSNYHEISPWENVFVPKNREQFKTCWSMLWHTKHPPPQGEESQVKWWYINQLRQILEFLIICSVIHFILYRKKTQNKTTTKPNKLWIKRGILIMQSSTWSHVQLSVKAPLIFNP